MHHKKKEENDQFYHQYTMLKKINEFYKKKGRSNAGKIMKLGNFNEIISQYHKKGIKIPKLPSTETNNLFKSNPLLNPKYKKIDVGLPYEEKDVDKGIVYLKKLKEIISLLSSKDGDIKKYFSEEDSKFYGDMLLFTSLKEKHLLRNQIENENIKKENQKLFELIHKTSHLPKNSKIISNYNRSNSTMYYSTGSMKNQLGKTKEEEGEGEEEDIINIEKSGRRGSLQKKVMKFVSIRHNIINALIETNCTR